MRLYRNATQTVFGEGVRRARIVAVGEQPGDHVRAPEQPSDTYITNAAKHFKFEPRKERRIHQKPNMTEI